MGRDDLRTVYESGRKKLEESGVPDAALDARLLLLEAFDLKFCLFSHQKRPASF